MNKTRNGFVYIASDPKKSPSPNKFNADKKILNREFEHSFQSVKKHCFDIWIKDHFFLAEKHSQFLYSCIDKIFKQLINPSQSGVTSNVHDFCGGLFLNKQLQLYSRSGGDFYELLDPKCITNINLRSEGYKNRTKANQEFNWGDVYVIHLMEGSWAK